MPKRAKKKPEVSIEFMGGRKYIVQRKDNGQYLTRAEITKEYTEDMAAENYKKDRSVRPGVKFYQSKNFYERTEEIKLREGPRFQVYVKIKHEGKEQYGRSERGIGGVEGKRQAVRNAMRKLNGTVEWSDDSISAEDAERMEPEIVEQGSVSYIGR